MTSKAIRHPEGDEEMAQSTRLDDVRIRQVCPLISPALLQYDLPAVIKFVAVCGFTAVAGFLSFHYWVQKTWLSIFLHGRRFDLNWPWIAARPGK